MTEEPIGAVADKTINRWQWWQNALRGDIGDVHDGYPQQGYYRTKRGDPVAIWQDDAGNWLAYEDRREVDAQDVWTWCCQNPVTYEAYNHRLENGSWPDEPPKVPPPPMGHNSSAGDPFVDLSQEFAGEAELATEFLASPVETKEQADKAAVWSKRIAEISKKADNERKAEKQPHLDASRAVDDKWRDIIDGSKDFVARLKKHVEPFLIAERRKEQERQRKAQEEAERLRKQAEEAAQEAADDEKAKLLQQAEEAEKAAVAKNASAGRTGAKVSIRVEKVGVVTDYEKAAAALVAIKHRDMIETIDKLAQRAAKSGMPFDGMEIKEVEKAV